jgi:hypothetical protein
LGTTSESATFKTIFSHSSPKRCGIVKTQYQLCGTRSTPAVQDLGKWLEYCFTEVATVELFARWRPIDEDSAVDAQKLCEYGFLGGYRARDSYRILIGRDALYLPMIVVPQKLQLVMGHNVMEADSLLSFKHPD